MRETPNQLGISYAVDGLLFEIIADRLSSNKHIKFTAHTFYGFSEYLIFAPCRCIAAAAETTLQILLNAKFDDRLLFEWQQFKSSQPVSRSDFDTAYYKTRCAKHRLAYPVSGNPQSILGVKLASLTAWYNQFYTADKVHICITGNFTPKIVQQLQFLRPLSTHPLQLPIQTDDPWTSISSSELNTTLPQENASLVISYPLSSQMTDILNGDALCCLIKRQLSGVLEKFGATLNLPMLILDVLPELRIHVNCHTKYLYILSESIISCIKTCARDIDSTTIDNIGKELMANYKNLYCDPADWNHFVGWNAIMGPWCDPVSLQSKKTFNKHVTLCGIRQVLHSLGSPMCFVI